MKFIFYFCVVSLQLNGDNGYTNPPIICRSCNFFLSLIYFILTVLSCIYKKKNKNKNSLGTLLNLSFFPSFLITLTEKYYSLFLIIRISVFLFTLFI